MVLINRTLEYKEFVIIPTLFLLSYLFVVYTFSGKNEYNFLFTHIGPTLTTNEEYKMFYVNSNDNNNCPTSSRRS